MKTPLIPGRDQGKAVCLPLVWVVDVQQAIHEDGLRMGIATELEIAKGTVQIACRAFEWLGDSMFRKNLENASYQNIMLVQ